ncbi:MAG: class I SAM-dependent methyltransferase [Acidobacteria bacterium]|nr:class I SAM-dependent methyltransferase [Acidobacteriota bacterium]
MPPLRRLLTRTFPAAADIYKATRSRLQRLRAGEGDVQVFDHILAENRWRDPDSASGTGSNLKQTETLRRELPAMLARLEVRTLLDAPCGDFHWLQHVELESVAYTGVDVVASLVAHCQASFGSASRQFMCRNILTDPLPRADAILSRDCLSHLSDGHALTALRNFRASGATWILATTYPSRPRNWDIVTGSWRPINLCAAPFNFPPPVDALVEGSTEYDGDFADKTLAVWRLDRLSLT